MHHRLLIELEVRILQADDGLYDCAPRRAQPVFVRQDLASELHAATTVAKWANMPVLLDPMGLDQDMLDATLVVAGVVQQRDLHHLLQARHRAVVVFPQSADALVILPEELCRRLRASLQLCEVHLVLCKECVHLLLRGNRVLRHEWLVHELVHETLSLLGHTKSGGNLLRRRTGRRVVGASTRGSGCRRQDSSSH